MYQSLPFADRRQRLFGLAVAIPGDGSGIAAGQGGVGRRIVPQRRVRRVHEGVDLGQDQGVLGHPLRTVEVAEVRLLGDETAQVLDAV